MIEVRDPGESNRGQSSNRVRYKTHNGQAAPEKSGRKARTPESSKQSEEEWDPQDDGRHVEGIAQCNGRAVVGVTHDECHRARRRGVQSHEYDDAENEDDAA